MPVRPRPLHEVPRVPVLSFYGGAGTVTGSRFLVDTPEARVLVDCGLFQGRKELRQRNWAPFPADPATIDAVVLTHAHVDHCGYLPALVRDGFAGRVHCTNGTRELAGIVLPDAGHLQEEEAEYANRKGFSKHHPALALYTEEDARRSLRSITAHAFDTEIEIAPGVHVTFRPAGHILGSAVVTMRLGAAGSPSGFARAAHGAARSPSGFARAAHGAGGDRRIVFSGDLGRPQHPILQPPAPIGDADIVVMESTYGNRRHDDHGALERFRDAIVRTAARGGTVLIPAFAVDRTEVVLWHLRELAERREIPDIPIYVDSPMALASLRVYRSAIERNEPEIDPGLAAMADPFDAGRVTEVREVAESKALADLRVPSIIISASGMATGGRVVHHLARLLPSHRNTVVLVGFQAPGTRGRLLADGARDIKMLGHYVPARADVVDLGAFSVHADAHELTDWLATATRPPRTTYVVHGEPDASAALAERINADDGQCAVVVRQGERVRLD